MYLFTDNDFVEYRHILCFIGTKLIFLLNIKKWPVKRSLTYDQPVFLVLYVFFSLKVQQFSVIHFTQYEMYLTFRDYD